MNVNKEIPQFVLTHVLIKKLDILASVMMVIKFIPTIPHNVLMLMSVKHVFVLRDVIILKDHLNALV